MSKSFDSTRLPAPEDERFVIHDKGRYGYIDGNGRIVIPPQFTKAAAFSEGLARVSIGEKYQRAPAFIDLSGKIIIGPGAPAELGRKQSDYDWYCDFHEGLAAFVIDGSPGTSGYIDRSGRVVVPAQFAERKDFSDGLACVRSKEPSYPTPPMKFIDPNGRVALSLTKEHFSDRFSEGRCVVQYWEDSVLRSYVVDRCGKVVIRAGEFDEIEDFDGGLARVRQKDKFGYVDLRGRVVIPVRYDCFGSFNGHDVALAWRGDKCWTINRAGRHIARVDIAGLEKSAEPFSSGLAYVSVAGKTGFIDQAGRVVVPPKQRVVERFHGSLARVWGRRKGYINRSGAFVWVEERWEKPVPYALDGLLMQFLPAGTLEAQPLEFEWEPWENVIVFVANDELDSLEKWYKKQLGRKYRVSWFGGGPDATLGFCGRGRDGTSGDVMLVEAADRSTIKDFYSWLPSKRLKAMQRKHRPRLIGLARLEWPRRQSG